MRNFDVIVVGAGPAGCASALKCSQLGFDVLLIEKEALGRHKPCGGVLPFVSVDVLGEIGLKKIPEEVMCSPPTLGLFYVPPTGIKNSGYVKNYRLLNVNRDRFDQWLQNAAESSGTQILYETEFLKFEEMQEGFTITARTRSRVMDLSTCCLIGADGVFSKVRKQLYPNLEMKTLTILQEHWRAEGNFGEYFYMFFKGNVTPTYGYVIPKDGIFIVGTGAPKGNLTPVSVCIRRFKTWLRREFAFNPVSLRIREAAAVPYGSQISGFPMSGEGNVTLVGEAAGFCNSLSGEGVRLAIESGIAAGEAMKQLEHSNGLLSKLYAQQIEGLNEFVCSTYEFAIDLTDEGREDFVKTELARF